MRYWNLFRNIQNWWLYLLVKFGLTNPDPVEFVSRSGVRIEVPRRLLQTFKEVFMDECYAEGLRQPPPQGATVLDIGANAGFFSLFAASRFADSRIHSFEPIPSNFKQLTRNRELNPGQQWTLHNKAVAGSDEAVTLTFDPEDSFTTSASITQPQQGDSVTVPGIRLDTFCSESGIERCHFLKMDCEGAEFDIFYNCSPETLARIDVIAMEVHPDSQPGHDMESLEKFFSDHGFTTKQYPVDMLWAWRG